MSTAAPEAPVIGVAESETKVPDTPESSSPDEEREANTAVPIGKDKKAVNDEGRIFRYGSVERQKSIRFGDGSSAFAMKTLQKSNSLYLDPAFASTDLTWTNTKLPGTFTKASMATVRVEERDLLLGIEVQKVTTKGKIRPRVLTISSDRFALFITHHKIKEGMESTQANRLAVPFLSSKGISLGPNDREKFVRYIDVADISYVHSGSVSSRKLELSRDQNRLKGKESLIDKKADQIVSIVHHGNLSLDVLVEDPRKRRGLIQTLETMMTRYNECKYFATNEARLLRYIWYDVDSNQDGDVSEKEFEGILKRINLHVTGKFSPKKCYKNYQKEKQIKGPNISYHDTMTLLYRIKTGHYDKTHSVAALSLWNELFGSETDYVAAEDFTKIFIHDCQKETDATVDDVKLLFDAVSRMEINRDESVLPEKDGFIGRHRFKNFLDHALNSAFNPDEQELNEETMNMPLSHYWISTSHNTYLTGDQLQSASSVSMYADALRRGCKCLELDCWDGDKNPRTGEPIPIIFHGHTVTSKILFEDVIRCVRAYMEYHHDTYPVILSLENHCSHPYQKVMASILKKQLGDYLYAPYGNTMSTRLLSEEDQLPSPAQLRGKVVIKGKRPPDKDESSESEVSLDDDDDDFDPYTDQGGEDSTREKKSPRRLGTRRKDSKPSEPKPPKIVKELSNLTLFHGVKFKKTFENSISLPPSHMHSISESKTAKILKKPGIPVGWRHFNTKHMTRNYPAGTRVDSSNYNPVVCWAMGAQLVALNFQTADAELMLNYGRFRQNGRSGYVLKPASVMGIVKPPEPVKLKIRVLAGTCLPKPEGAKAGEVIDPYVRVAVYDVRSKNGREVLKESSYSTSSVGNNGYNPGWNESKFWECHVENPDIAMVLFTLNDTDVALDDEIAVAAIPVLCLRRGYRSVMLYDKYGTQSGAFGFGCLLVEIQFE